MRAGGGGISKKRTNRLSWVYNTGVGLSGKVNGNKTDSTTYEFGAITATLSPGWMPASMRA